MMSESHSANRDKRKALGLVTDDNSGGYFVVECQGCGAVYPSFQCLGGGQIADTGDYDDAYCPLCEHEAPDECDNTGLVWNTQQLKINALQQRLNAADQQIDELTRHQAEPVNWAAPKTVGQLIRQLQTLDPELETHAMLRIPDYKDGKKVRSCPLSISYERMEGPWLSNFKGDGRKVIAIWAKPDPREPQDQGETLTEFAES